ncbi:hypothetical protein, partial [Alistipes finegoldii]|uniref:hypothetical protein n=1 Tax=Alistipes finegoldii TaxID=214856 RepID=UPI0025A01BEC
PRQNPAGFPPLSDAEPERGVSRMKGKNLGRLFLGYDKKEEERSSSFLIMASACRAQLFRFAVVMLSLLAALFPSACCPLPFGLLPSSLRLVAIIPSACRRHPSSACRFQLFCFPVIIPPVHRCHAFPACRSPPFRLPPSCFAFWFVAIMFSPLASGGCTWLPVPVPAGGECRSDAAAAINI